MQEILITDVLQRDVVGVVRGGPAVPPLEGSAGFLSDPGVSTMITMLHTALPAVHASAVSTRRSVYTNGNTQGSGLEPWKTES